MTWDIMVNKGKGVEAENDDKVVMTGGSFKSDEPVTFQPRVSRSENKSRPSVARAPFDDTLSERNWSAPLCECKGRHNNGSCMGLFCCWCYHKYMLATRLGETPFMGLIPCAAFALRIQIRTLFGIKGSVLKDFATAMFCEPCAVCQMTKELDHIGL